MLALTSETTGTHTSLATIAVAAMCQDRYIPAMMQEALVTLYAGRACFQAIAAVRTSLRALKPQAGVLVLTTQERACAFWESRARTLWQAVQAVHAFHVSHPRAAEDVVAQCFFDLPAEWPVTPPQHGLTYKMVQEVEGMLYMDVARNSGAATHSIADAYKRCWSFEQFGCYPVAVLLSFIQYTGTPPEMLLGLLYSIGGWVAHKEFGAILDPMNRMDRITRPRTLVQIVAESNAGKSPFYNAFVSPFLRMVEGSHSQLFIDGGKKGIHVAKATAADFASRMDDTGGCMLWASPENLLCLDIAYAKGKTPDKSDRKIDFNECLGTQNGVDFGPMSQKAVPGRSTWREPTWACFTLANLERYTTFGARSLKKRVIFVD